MEFDDSCIGRIAALETQDRKTFTWLRRVDDVLHNQETAINGILKRVEALEKAKPGTPAFAKAVLDTSLPTICVSEWIARAELEKQSKEPTA